MSIEEQLIGVMQRMTDVMDRVEKHLAAEKTDYCDSQEAALIIGIDNIRDLKVLHEAGLLPRLPRKGNAYKYKKSDCLKAAEALDKGVIKLQSYTHGNNNKQNRRK